MHKQLTVYKAKMLLYLARKVIEWQQELTSNSIRVKAKK